MPKTPLKDTSEAHSLRELLESTDEKLARLFVMVMNCHAGYQLEERSTKQLMDVVRREIENSLNEQNQHIDDLDP
jgi:hypothetical protein